MTQAIGGTSSTAKIVTVAIFYGTTSLSMNFLNKLVISSFEFNFPFFIMTCQMLVIMAVLDLARFSGFLSLPPYSWKDAGRDLLPASVLFALHSILSLTALHGMNIPMYGAIKRCTPLVSLGLAVLVLKKGNPSKPLVASVLMMTFGCIVAGLGDLQFDKYAYLMGGLSVFAQAGYLTLVQKTSADTKKSALEMIYVNSYNTLPFFAICTILTGEISPILRADCLTDPGFHLAFVAVITWSGVLNFSQFLCSSVCSALTTSLVGTTKSVLQTWAGFFSFGGVPFHPLNVLGLSMNIAGALMYTHCKYAEQKEKGPSIPTPQAVEVNGKHRHRHL